MSLKEKLSQKKEKQIMIKKEKESKNFEEEIININSQINEFKTKKERIGNLRDQLQEAYRSAQAKVDIFGGDKKSGESSPKEDLHNIYQEHKKVLKAEGINNYQEMVQANPDEEEVKKYREKASNMKEAVASLVTIKRNIQEELPDLELNFSGGNTEDKEKENHRDLAFNKIDKYLLSLDQKVSDLEKEKKQIYFETPEGKIAKTKQELGDFKNDLFLDLKVDGIDKFHLSFKELEIGDKNGPELVKGILKQGLEDNLKEKIFNNKSEQEQEALKDYEKIEALNNQADITQEIQETKKLEKLAIEHLDQIIENNEEIKKNIENYFNSQSDFETEGARLLDYILASSNLSTDRSSSHCLDAVLSKYQNDKEYLQNKNFSDYYQSIVYSSKYYSKVLENYRLVFQDILDNSNENTEFLGLKSNQDTLIDRFSSNSNEKNKEENVRKKLGITEFYDMKAYELDIPQSLQYDDYQKIWEKAKEENIKWNEEQEEISRASSLVMDKKWAEVQQSYYQDKNKKFIEEYNKDKEYCKNAQFSISHLEELSAEEQDHLLSFTKEFYELKIYDLSAEKIRNEYREKEKELRNKKDNYIQEIVDRINQKAQKAGTGIFGSKKKKVLLEKKASGLQNFIAYDFEKLNNLSADFNPEEKKELENIYLEYNVLNKKYRENEKINNEISLKLKVAQASRMVDKFLVDKQLSIKDFLKHCQSEEKVKEEYLNSLPIGDQEILNNIEKNKKETEESTKKWEENKNKFKHLNKKQES